jgi:hypothetical protein
MLLILKDLVPEQDRPRGKKTCGLAPLWRESSKIVYPPTAKELRKISHLEKTRVDKKNLWMRTRRVYETPHFQTFVPPMPLRRRRIRRSYGELTDRQLLDIGLTPLELQKALSLPFGQSAGDALACAAAKEAAKW